MEIIGDWAATDKRHCSELPGKARKPAGVRDGFGFRAGAEITAENAWRGNVNPKILP